MARLDPQVNLRLPADLKSEIDAAAAASGRSMTSEIVARLRQSFDAHTGSPQELELMRHDLQKLMETTLWIAKQIDEPLARQQALIEERARRGNTSHVVPTREEFQELLAAQSKVKMREVVDSTVKPAAKKTLMLRRKSTK